MPATDARCDRQVLTKLLVPANARLLDFDTTDIIVRDDTNAQ